MNNLEIDEVLTGSLTRAFFCLRTGDLHRVRGPRPQSYHLKRHHRTQPTRVAAQSKSIKKNRSWNLRRPGVKRNLLTSSCWGYRPRQPNVSSISLPISVVLISVSGRVSLSDCNIFPTWSLRLSAGQPARRSEPSGRKTRGRPLASSCRQTRQAPALHSPNR